MMNNGTLKKHREECCHMTQSLFFFYYTYHQSQQSDLLFEQQAHLLLTLSIRDVDLKVFMNTRVFIGRDQFNFLFYRPDRPWFLPERKRRTLKDGQKHFNYKQKEVSFIHFTKITTLPTLEFGIIIFTIPPNRLTDICFTNCPQNN